MIWHIYFPCPTWINTRGICETGLSQSKVTLGIGHQSIGVVWWERIYRRNKRNGYPMDRLGIYTTLCIFLICRLKVFFIWGKCFLLIIFEWFPLPYFWILCLRDANNFCFILGYLCHSYIFYFYCSNRHYFLLHFLGLSEVFVSNLIFSWIGL